MKLRRKLGLNLALSLIMLALFSSVVLALDDWAPTITSFSPADNAVVNTAIVPIKFTVTDADDEIKDADYYIKVDGTAIPTTLEYKGHWEYEWDYDYWVVDAYNEATIAGTTGTLKDGTHSIEVQAMDKSGNAVKQTRTITVASKPLIANLQPANGSATAKNTGFSVRITDNDALNLQSLQATLDGETAELKFDPSTGIAAYNSVIPDGTHSVKVSVADMAGNTAQQQWSFVVRTTGPDLTFAGDGQTYPTYKPALSVALKSTVKILDSAVTMQIDGQTVPAKFEYKGHWEYEWDYEYYVVDSYKEGTLSFTPSLKDGARQLSVTSKDELGNQSTKTWSFNVAQPPIFSSLEPANGAAVNFKPIIKGVIWEPNGSVDLGSVSLSVDNSIVEPVLSVAADGKVTATYSSDTLNSDSYHAVLLSAKDSAGNQAQAAWKFFGTYIGSETGFTRQTPASQTVVTADTAVVSAHLTDLNLAYDISGITLAIDGGSPVKPTVTGRDSEYLINYTTGKLTDGSHSVTINVPNKVSGSPEMSTNWSFAVEAPPVITKPSPTGTVISSKPELAAYAADNSGVASASFTLDGQTLSASINTTFKRISAAVAEDLAPGEHNASLTVVDASGNEATADWQFKVDPDVGIVGPDMPIATNSTCWQCHQKEYNRGHILPTQCSSCHPATITKYDVFRDCIGCHFSSKYITRTHSTTAKWTWANLPNRQHAVNDNHLSVSKECGECHSLVLTREHNRPENKDKNGNPINCDTCHTGSYLATVSSEEAARVTGAIANKDTKCSSCHEQAGHAALHESGLDSKCLTCHNGNLQGEHLSNSTTGGKEYTCNTCHASSRNEVTRAIRNNQLSCSSCHTTAHSLPLTAGVPGDIPLYQSFSFSKPIEAAIFAGDPGLPADFAAKYQAGLVVLSNRQQVNVADVWNFYNTQLAAEKWTLKSQSQGAAYFSAEFEKNGRFLTVRCFDSAFGDGSGSQTAGYRIEIWYQ